MKINIKYLLWSVVITTIGFAIISAVIFIIYMGYVWLPVFLEWVIIPENTITALIIFGLFLFFSCIWYLYRLQVKEERGEIDR